LAADNGCPVSFAEMIDTINKKNSQGLTQYLADLPISLLIHILIKQRQTFGTNDCLRPKCQICKQ
jgi:hypothetical protein